MLKKLLFSIIFLFNISLNAQNPTILGKVNNSSLTEISGIIPSKINSGMFWVHNDSGNKSEIYLINQKTELVFTVKLDGVKLVDAEDIARFDMNGENYLLIADIGNNLKDRDTLSLYLLKEPKWSGEKEQTVKFSDLQTIKFKYKDAPRDAEAVFVDPVDKQIYIISKRDFKSSLFSLPLNVNSDMVLITSKLIDLPATFCTAADISADGKYILVKNLTHIYLWERNNKESMYKVFENKPKEIPYLIEPQGEAICFDLYDRFFYTISERPLGLDSYLYQYKY